MCLCVVSVDFVCDCTPDGSWYIVCVCVCVCVFTLSVGCVCSVFCVSVIVPYFVG